MKATFSLMAMAILLLMSLNVSSGKDHYITLPAVTAFHGTFVIEAPKEVEVWITIHSLYTHQTYISHDGEVIRVKVRPFLWRTVISFHNRDTGEMKVVVGNCSYPAKHGWQVLVSYEKSEPIFRCEDMFEFKE
ncbi:hypothetical protein IIA95_04240 [Patescibacteria group bacterium]|nr:hypothetical protein [Patescibacteria group bacterium]